MKKIVVGLLVVVPLLLVGAVMLVLLNLEPLVNSYKADIQKLANDTLGRKVDFGPVETRWDGGPSVQFNRLALAAADPAQPPTFTLEEAVLKVDLWKAVFSLGKNLEVRAFVIRKPVIRAARNADGTWDFQDILQRLQQRATESPEPAAEPDDNGDPQDYRGLRIAGLAIEHGRLEVHDGVSNKTLTVDDLNLTVSEIIPGKDVTARLTLFLDDATSRAPFLLEAGVRPLPANLDFSQIPAASLRLTLADLDVSPWAALAPRDALAPSGGRLALDLTATTNAGANNADVAGFLDLKGLTLRQRGVRGTPSDLRVDVDIHGDVPNKKIQVKRLDLKGPSVALQTRVSLVSPGVAGIQDANVELRVQDLARVLAVLPKGSTLLPTQLTLQGPFEVDLKGDASKGNLRVDLDRAALAWADVFDKRADVPLHLAVTAQRAGERVRFPSVELVLDSARLGGTAEVGSHPSDPMDASLDTGPVVLSSLKGIFPPFRKALASKGGKVDGTIRLQAQAKAAGKAQDAHAQLELSGMDVVLDGTVVKGGATLAAHVTPAGDTTTATLVANLTGLLVSQRGEKGEMLVTKALNMPAGVDVKVVTNGVTATVEKGEITLGQTVVRARGTAQGLDKDAPTLEVTVDPLDVAFDDVRAVAPAASVLPAGGHLKARVAVSGNPRKQESLAIKVDNLNLTAAGNTVAGNAQVHNLLKPVVDLNLTTVDLDFDQLRALSKNTSIPRAGYLRTRITAKVDTAHLATTDVAVEDLDTRVYNSRFKGHVRFKDVERPRFDILITGDQLDLNEVLAQLPKGEANKQEEQKPQKEAHGLPEETRRLLKKVEGVADLKVGRVIYEKHVMDNVTALIKVRNGDVTFEKLNLEAYGGRVLADGSVVDTDEEYLRSALKLAITNIDVGHVLRVNTTHPGAADGKLDLTATVNARGMTSDDIVNSLQGPVKFKSRSLVLHNANLLAGIAAPIAKVAAMAGKLGGKAADPKAGTEFKDFEADATFEAGKMILAHPVVMPTAFGALSMEGYVRFDSNLNLLGSAQLSPDVVAGMTGNKFRPQKPVAVPIHIKGTWHQPSVEGVDVASFLQGAGIGDLAKVAQAAAEEARKRVEEEAARAREEAERLQADAQKRAGEEAERLKQAAQRKAEDARRAAEEEAKKQAAEARRRAEEEAKKRLQEGQKRGEEEAKKRADEARKKAEQGLKNLFK
jgi:hypothetical protein